MKKENLFKHNDRSMIKNQLTLHRSNKLENLTEALGILLNSFPVTDVFRKEEFIVYSNGIERYIEFSLSKRLGIFSNASFHRPSSLFWKIAKAFNPKLTDINQLDNEIIRWKLLSLFLNKELLFSHPCIYHQLNQYIDKYQLAPYDLASELSTLFMNYMIYRPEWIDKWSINQLTSKDEDELWQKDLWMYLSKDNQFLNRVEIWHHLKRSLENFQTKDLHLLPERIFIFNTTSIAPLYLELFSLLSKHIPIHLFVLEPCQEDWGYIKKNHDEKKLEELGNPLLASLGKQGQDFFFLLNEKDPFYEQDLFPTIIENNQSINMLNNTIIDASNDSFLHCIQNDIQKLSHPTKVPMDLIEHDHSISIHITHSPVRELQILKDQIIDFLERNPDKELHDIAVLTPNIELYIPFIEGIFGQECADELPLFYSISDTKLFKENAFLGAINSFLNFIESRFEVKSVLKLLENPRIQKQFSFHPSQFIFIKKIIKNYNISWAWDEKDRKRYKATGKQYTWKSGIKRIENNLEKYEQNQQIILNQLISFIQKIAFYYKNWQEKKSIDNWVFQLTQSFSEIIYQVKEDTYFHQIIFQSLHQWKAEIKEAKFEELIDFKMVKHHIIKWMSQPSSIGFLKGGITFCSLVPMRSIPFSMIALLGMNDGDFPRKNIHSSFDLIQKNKQRGDLSRRDDDRYLFLETLLSARDKLYLSFVGKSIRTDEDLSPSPLLNELIDTISLMTDIPSKTLWKKWVHTHPLHYYAKQYFTQENQKIKSYRKNIFKALEKTIKKPPKSDIPFWTTDHKKTEKITELNLEDFIHFWKNPIKYWLRQELLIDLPWMNHKINYQEPFSMYDIKGKRNTLNEQAKKLNQTYFEARLNDSINIDDINKKFKEEDFLPSGYFSELWLSELQYKIFNIKSDYFSYKKVQSTSFLYEDNSICIHCQFDHIYQNNQDQLIQLFFQQDTINNSNKIEFYLYHLFFSYFHTNTNKTILMSPIELITFNPYSQAQAKKIILLWIQYQQKGLNNPLPFFTKTSLESAKARVKDNSKLTETIKIWQKNFLGSELNDYSIAQKDYPEVKIVFQNNPIPLTEDSLSILLIDDLLVELIKNMEQETLNL